MRLDLVVNGWPDIIKGSSLSFHENKIFIVVL